MKVVRVAVQVIGFVATVASFIPGPHQAIAQIVAAAAAVVSAGLAIMAKPPRPQGQGQLTSYRLDPAAPIPYMMGRTQYAGSCVHRDTFGKENKKQVFVSVYSLGPIQQIEKFTADRREVIIGFNQEAQGAWEDHMWLRTQLGECPSPRLTPPGSQHDDPGDQYYLPNWGPNAKLSGLAASMWILKWDKDQKYFTNGPPVPGIIGKGVKVYDPRLDSTFPGGSGACRPLQESTYVYSDTPHLHALTYALGRWQNGKRRFGIGFPVDAIDIQYFAEAASVDEANGWTISGVIFSNDDKWNALKLIMQAGGGQPITLGGRLSGLQTAPKVSAVTITSDELVGPASVVATQSQRQRLNGGIPRYRSEAHEWEVVAAEAVRVPAYVTQDGGERTREFTFDLVADSAQARQLTAYQLADMREFGPIELTLKIRWQGLRPGDCATLHIPELGLNNQKVVVLTRSFDVERGGVAMTFKSETDSKHAFALGQASGVPPMPELSATDPYGPNNIPPAPTTWALSSHQLDGPAGAIPAVRFTGTFTNTIAEEVEFSIREVGTTEWIVVGQSGAGTTEHVASQVAAGSIYEGRVRELVQGYPSNPQILAPVTAGAIQSGSIIGQGPGATAPATDVLNQYVPASGGNRVRYSLLEKGTTGWSTFSYSGVTGPALVRADNGTYIYAYGTATATSAGQYLNFGAGTSDPSKMNALNSRVTPGERIFAGGRVNNGSAPADQIWQLQIYWFNSSGTFLSAGTIASGTGNPGFTQYGAFFTVPSGAVYASVVLGLTCGATTGTLTGRLAQPMIASATANQTTYPAFSPGPSSEYGADVTLDNTSAGIVGQGSLATLNSVVVGTHIKDAAGNVLTDYALLNTEQVFAPRITYDFSSGTMSFTSGGITLSAANGVLTGTTTNADPQLTKTSLSLDGSKHYVIRARIRNLSYATTTSWQGICYYARSGGHGYSGSYNKIVPKPQQWNTGEWCVVEWDMSALTAGGNDFVTGIITALRWDFFNDGVPNGSQFEVDWITVGDKSMDLLLARGVDDNADVTLDNTSAGIVGQGPGATAPAADVLNVYVPVGQNAIYNSGFDNGTSAGWSNGPTNGTTGFTPSRGVNGIAGYYGQLNVAHARVVGTPAASTYFDAYVIGSPYPPTLDTLKRYALPLAPGDRMFASILAAYHRLNYAALIARYYDGSGSLVTETILATGGTPNGAANGDPTNFTRIGGFATIAAGSSIRYAIIYVRGYSIGGQADPYLFFTQAMLCKVAAGQTSWPPYQPGSPDRFSDKTGENVASAIAGQGPGATAPGGDVLNQYIPSGDVNRVRYSRFESGQIGWQFQGGSPATVSFGTSGGKNYMRADIAFASTYNNCYIQTAMNNQGYIPVTAGERLLFSAVIGTTFGSQTSFEIRARWFDASGAELAGSQISPTYLGSVAFGSARQGGFITVPAGAVKATFLVLAENRTDHPQTGILYIAEPMVASATSNQTVWPSFTAGPSSEYGADVTTQISGPAAANINYDYTGTTIDQSVDLAYKLAAGSGNITSGVTATYTVVEGTVNGRTSASGAAAITVTDGIANLSISSLATATATFEVTLTYNGVARKMVTKLTKVLAAAPAGGGAGSSVSKTSGFTSINTSTFTDITGSLSLTTPAGKTSTRTVVSLAPRMQLSSDQWGPWNIEFKLQRNISGTWTDIGSVQNSDPDPIILDSDEFGPASSSGTMSATIDNTSLVQNTSYSYRIMARMSTGSPSTNGAVMSFSGSVTITCP